MLILVQYQYIFASLNNFGAYFFLCYISCSDVCKDQYFGLLGRESLISSVFYFHVQ
jgi:hypothetical protein